MFKILKNLNYIWKKIYVKNITMAEQIKEQGQKLWNNILEGPLGNDSSPPRIELPKSVI